MRNKKHYILHILEFQNKLSKERDKRISLRCKISYLVTRELIETNHVLNLLPFKHVYVLFFLRAC